MYFFLPNLIRDKVEKIKTKIFIIVDTRLKIGKF